MHQDHSWAHEADNFIKMAEAAVPGPKKPGKLHRAFNHLTPHHRHKKPKKVKGPKRQPK